MKKIDRILATGAAGLIGSSLVEHLLAESYENVIPLERARRDLIDTPATFGQVERLRPDYVFHAAARLRNPGKPQTSGAPFYDNCMINSIVTEASRRAGVRKITVMGTGAVYPFPSPGLPLKEDMIFSADRIRRTLVPRTPSSRCSKPIRIATV